MATPSITVCVSTHNRAHLLPQLIEHLEAQTLDAKEFEVVIVDDGSADETWEVLEAFTRTSPLQLRIHKHATGQGPAAGRNRAWRDAQAPICAFTDDDCMPAPHWLAKALDGLADKSAVGVGRVTWPQAEDASVGLFSRTMVTKSDNARWGATANLIARKADLDAVGGFDESFRFAGGEDTDLLLRILKSGADFVFLLDAVVYHPVAPSNLRALIRDQRRWVDIPAVFAKHPAARTMLHRKYFWAAAHPRAMLAVLGLLVSPAFPVAGLLAVPWAHYRVCQPAFPNGRAERIIMLPGTLVLDLVEVWTMVRGSVRHHTVVL